jgi:putative transcriptional regulator
MIGEQKLNVAKLERELAVGRGVIRRLYREEYTRVDKDVIDKLCKYFDCQVGDLFEYIED